VLITQSSRTASYTTQNTHTHTTNHSNKMSNTAFIRALETEGVQCQIVEIDYQRSFSAFGTVETNYIIQVRATPECDARCRFKTFSIEKSFHNFRNLITAFKKASKDATDQMRRSGGWKNVPESTQNLIAFSDAVSHVIDSEPISHFIGKMTFSSVQELASERRNTLNKALRVLTENYPASDSGEVSSKPIKEFKKIVNDFFLTDHVYEDDSDSSAEKAINADASVDSLDCSRSNRAVISMNGVGTGGDGGIGIGRTKKPNSPSQSPRGPSLKMKKRTVKKEKSKGSLTSSPSTSSRSAALLKEDGDLYRSKPVNEPVVESPVRPKSVKKRMSTRSRTKLRRELMTSKELSFHDNAAIVEHHSYLDSPFTVAGMVIGLMLFFLWLPRVKITVELDVAALVFIALIMCGMSLAPQAAPSHYGNVQPVNRNRNRKRVDSETLMRMSLGNDKSKRLERKPTFLETIVSTATNTDTFEKATCLSPIKEFPKDAEIGSLFNCWSEPICNEFKVRGANYLKDKIKFESGPFLFPARGVDIFLSDCCPEHIARYKAILGTKLRDKPTFIINYRLPWGNCVTYSEIPSKFVPFLNHCYEKSSPIPSMEGMTNSEVCACRYLMADSKKKR